eukprot:Skav203078  [mRNA]  locus=scaffold2182:90002:90414:+ [translate_table: standard]
MRQRLQIMVPIIIKKLERLAGPDSVKVVKLLQDYVAPASYDWQKKVRQVKIHRSLERMNTSALFDLAGSELFATDVLEAFNELRQNHFSFECHDEDPDTGDDGRSTVFCL